VLTICKIFETALQEVAADWPMTGSQGIDRIG